MNKSLVAALLIAFVSIMGSQQAFAGYGYKNYSFYKSNSYKTYSYKPYSSKAYVVYKVIKKGKYKILKKFVVKWKPVSAS